MNLSAKLVLGATAAASLAIPFGVAVAAHDQDDVGNSPHVTSPSCGDGLVGDQFARTEPFFGLSRPGGRITEQAWRCLRAAGQLEGTFGAFGTTVGSAGRTPRPRPRRVTTRGRRAITV